MTRFKLPTNDASLAALLNPSSVAVVGASPEFARYGGRIWKFINMFGFQGEIFAVNPKYQSIGEAKCYADLKSLPKRPDHVGISVGSAYVRQILEECAELGIKAATVFSAGYAERGDPESKERQEELADYARSVGIRLLGPNCNGFINWHSRLAMGASAAVMERNAPAGNIGVISQSGGVGQINVMWRAIRAGLGISYQVACGNEADIDSLDVANFMIDDPRTDVILMAIEGLRDGAKLAAVADKAAAAGKPILVFKIGRSEGGAKAAASHTGAMTGVDAVHDAAMTQMGILRVEDTNHLYEAAMLFAQKRPVAAQGLSSTSVSGGCVAMIADQAERYGLNFPAYSESTTAALAKIIPGFLTVANPTDLSVELQGNAALEDVLDIIARDDGIGINLPILTMAPRRDLDTILKSAKASNKPTAIIWTGGCTDEPLPEINHVMDGIPIYRDIDTGLRAAGLVARHAEFLRRRSSRTKAARPTDVNEKAARAVLANSTDAALTERESKQVLAAYGIPVTREALAKDADEAVARFRESNGKVAMKIEAASILHKTDIGCVRLNVDSEDGVREAYNAIMANARKAHPDSKLNGVLVQEMAGAGTEIILGASTDEIYGPVLALGLGGIFAEFIGKPVLRLPPHSQEDAREMIDAMAGRKILSGVRGRAPSDVAALEDIIVRFSWMVSDLRDQISEIDMNPLIVGTAGAIAVDALIVRT